LEDLKTAVEALQRAREAKLAELQAIDQALAALGVGTQDRTLPELGNKDFEDLGITAATKRYLRQVGEPRTTREIADALDKRGVKTRSKKNHYIATVYATLRNSKAFKRTQDKEKWELREPLHNS
jgi:hypothetical protein